MKIDRHQLVADLREQGANYKAQRVIRDLCDPVDTVEDAATLGKLGIDPGLLAPARAGTLSDADR